MVRLPAISALIVAVSVFPTAAGELRLQEGRSALRDDWSDRVERARQESARFVGAAVDAFRLRKMPSPRDQRGVTLPPSYLDDPTLRYGDAIAVDGRLIVFRGSGMPPHRPAEFEEVDTAGTLGGIHDRELRAIDKALARDGRSR